MNTIVNIVVVLAVSTIFVLARPGVEDEKPFELNANDKEVQKGILKFGHNLLKDLHHDDHTTQSNTLISPINVYSALNLVYLGAGGKSIEDLSTVLGLEKTDDPARVAGNVESVGKMVARLQYKSENPYAVQSEESFANGMFVQNDLPLNGKYMTDVTKYLPSSSTKNVDFSQHPKEATDEINKWVSEKTKGRISQLYKDPLDSSTVLTITSSLYFNGKWKDNFPEYRTKMEKFNMGSTEVEVKMMNNQKFVPYVANKNLKFEAIRLQYQGDEYEMAFILPNTDQKLLQLIDDMKAEDLQAVFEDEGAEGKTHGVDYKIPKMKFSWSKSLKETLSNQGMKSLFENADLRFLTNATAIKISDVHHATEIEIDELGTKASAVTGVTVVLYSLPIPPKNPKPFHLNRPFMMFLYHRPTQTIQFSALVHKPVV